MCSYWDALEEGRWVFLKKLASSSSILQENGSYYHVHYMLCCVTRTKECLQPDWEKEEEGVQNNGYVLCVADDGGMRGKSSGITKHFNLLNVQLRHREDTQQKGQMLPADKVIVTHCFDL